MWSGDDRNINRLKDLKKSHTPKRVGGNYKADHMQMLKMQLQKKKRLATGKSCKVWECKFLVVVIKELVAYENEKKKKLRERSWSGTIKNLLSTNWL